MTAKSNETGRRRQRNGQQKQHNWQKMDKDVSYHLFIFAVCSSFTQSFPAWEYSRCTTLRWWKICHAICWSGGWYLSVNSPALKLLLLKLTLTLNLTLILNLSLSQILALISTAVVNGRHIVQWNFRHLRFFFIDDFRLMGPYYGQFVAHCCPLWPCFGLLW